MGILEVHLHEPKLDVGGKRSGKGIEEAMPSMGDESGESGESEESGGGSMGAILALVVLVVAAVAIRRLRGGGREAYEEGSHEEYAEIE